MTICPIRRVVASLCFAVTLGAAPAFAQTQATGTIRGLIVDAADGRPIADVPVQIQEAGLSVKSNAEGKFELTGVVPGKQVLYVSFVGFALVKRPVDVTAGAAIDVVIALAEGTGTYTETVTVTAKERFRELEPAVVAQQTLGSADIQNLRNLLTNDPMRAIQVLPGVTTGDDFRSEFAVRGSGFSRMNFTFDGVQTELLLHKVQQAGDGGSIAMLNGDILDGITLLNGSYPQRFGNRIGAELDFHMREGSRDRTQVRIGVSGTDASVVMEGPLGGNKAGSWLVSARKSYLELILKKIREEGDDFGFGFTDLQAKAAYDLSPRNHVEVSTVAGRSRLDQTAPPEEIGDVTDGRSRASLTTAAWRFTASPKFIVTQRVAAGFLRFTNENRNHAELGHGTSRELTWRADAALALPKSMMFEFGAQVQARRHEEAEAVEFDGTNFLFRGHTGEGTMSSAFGQLKWTSNDRFKATAGARADYWSLTSEASASPWMQAEYRLTGSLLLRGGAGIYRQVADLAQATGSYAPATPLRAERAVQTDIGIEQSIGANSRWQATFYNRNERNVARLASSEFKLVNGKLVFPSFGVWTDTLGGYARGIELLVQRRSNTGLSGTASYSYGISKYREPSTGESFYGDYDQRHTFNAYGLYRLTDRFSLSGKLRVGSNTPALGFWAKRNGLYFVGETRNDVRLPTYARLDLRASRTFHWSGKRLSLFAEVMNVLDRENLRYEPPGINTKTFQAFGLTSSMIPRIPSLGILIEF